ncbi:MAG: four helix bundle protein [Clostridia bacterium]|jgi:four helix bundle protein|nr:four helix bundle protein [Clostridia bacterium]
MPKKDNRLITYEKMNNLIYYSRNLLVKFPKSERFDLCSDIKNTLYECLKNIVFAWKEYKDEDKLKALRIVDIDLVFLKSLILIAYKSQYITQKNFMVWNENVSELGKLIGGWIKTCQKN